MSHTILFDQWYTALQASQELELPLERVQKLFEDVVAGKHGNVAVALYQGPDEPMITGRALLSLIGQLQPPTGRHRNSRY